MAEEQRFSLSMSYKNIKDNKITIIIFVGVFLTVGLYVTFPVLMLTAAENVTDDLGFLMGRIQNNSQKSEYGGKSDPFDNSTFTFNFTSIITPPQCKEDNVIGLGENVFLSICKTTLINTNFANDIVIDIRKFTGGIKTGIKPTIKGINLSINQWNVIKKNFNIINNIIKNVTIGLP